MKDVKLTLTSVTLDGISTTAEFKVPSGAGRDLTQAIQVPEAGCLKSHPGGPDRKPQQRWRKQDLTAQRTWSLNGIDKTELTADGHLSKFGEDYVYELAGKKRRADRGSADHLRPSPSGFWH